LYTPPPLSSEFFHEKKKRKVKEKNGPLTCDPYSFATLKTKGEEKGKPREEGGEKKIAAPSAPSSFLNGRYGGKGTISETGTKKKGEKEKESRPSSRRVILNGLRSRHSERRSQEKKGKEYRTSHRSRASQKEKKKKIRAKRRKRENEQRWGRECDFLQVEPLS